uniref:Protein-tyrosine-phosphatase n=1 Tax=Panagrellus redivivus TaxID=6233 RepID=A0A7E4VD65_PANRE
MALMADLFRVFCCFWLFIGRIAAQSEHRVPDPPENVRVKLEATSATLWWEPPSTAGDILVRGYTISYGIETPSRRVVIEGVDTNAFTIEGLKPNATYVFAVTAYNEADGEDSERVLLTGTSHAADPRNSAFRFPAPSDITVIGTSATDVEISWTDPMPESRDENSLELGTKRRFYIVRYYASTHPEKARKISTEKTKAFITNLTPETSYNILIRTVLPNGQESPWSREEVVKTSSKHQNHNDLAFLNTPSTRVHVSESCDFEVPYLCDFFSEATAPLQFRREASVSTGGTMSTHSGDAGHYMVAQSSQDLKDTFGRLFSPVWNFNAAGHICVSLWVYVRADSYGILTVSVQYEGDSINMAVPVFKKRMEGMKKQKWSEITAESKIHRHKSFQLIVEVRKASPRARFWVAVDDIHARGGHCAHSKGLLKGNVAVIWISFRVAGHFIPRGSEQFQVVLTLLHIFHCTANSLVFLIFNKEVRSGFTTVFFKGGTASSTDGVTVVIRGKKTSTKTQSHPKPIS